MAEPTLFKNGYVAWTTSTGSSAYVEIAGVKSISMPLSKAELANGVMGDGAEVMYPGLISAPISVTCRQDFTTAAAGVDKQAWARWNGEMKFRVKVRPVDGAVADDNPSYIFDRVGLFNHTPIEGQHGVLLENKLEFRLLSGATVARSSST